MCSKAATISESIEHAGQKFLSMDQQEAGRKWCMLNILGKWGGYSRWLQKSHSHVLKSKTESYEIILIYNIYYIQCIKILFWQVININLWRSFLIPSISDALWFCLLHLKMISEPDCNALLFLFLFDTYFIHLGLLIKPRPCPVQGLPLSLALELT